MYAYSYDNQKSRSKRARWKEITLKIAMILALPLFVALGVQWALREFWIYPLEIQSDSMHLSGEKSSGIAPGSRIFLLHPHLKSVQTGDVVYVELSSRLFLLCRVAASEGEQIEIVDRTILVNGRSLNRGKSNDQAILPHSLSVRDQLPHQSLFPGEFFCINDNWDNTSDSRIYGALPYSRIRGIKVFGSLLGFS